MKKEHPLRSMLGLTQLDTAMLLGVTRSQWAMFELGQRSLPLAAQQLMAALLGCLQEPLKADKSVPVERVSVVEQLLQQNHLQREVTQRKLVEAERRLQAQVNLARVGAFLAQRQRAEKTSTDYRVAVVARAAAAGGGVWAEQLEQHRHRQELLELEKLMLESRLRQLRRSSEDPQGA